MWLFIVAVVPFLGVLTSSTCGPALQDKKAKDGKNGRDGKDKDGRDGKDKDGRGDRKEKAGTKNATGMARF